MKSVALYARVSTVDKDQNPETQLLPLRDWAKSNTIGLEVTEYIDQASATDLRGRVRWGQLQRDVAAGQVGAVVVLRLDRAFRSMAHAMAVLEQWKISGVRFVSITQQFDTSSALGVLALHILLAFAEFERGLLKERGAEGMARAKAEGKHVGRPKGSKDKGRRRRAGYMRRWEEKKVANNALSK